MVLVKAYNLLHQFLPLALPPLPHGRRPPQQLLPEHDPTSDPNLHVIHSWGGRNNNRKGKEEEVGYLQERRRV